MCCVTRDAMEAIAAEMSLSKIQQVTEMVGSKSIVSSNILLSSYGGKIGNVRFGNTCPIDNWLAMISIIEEEKLEQIINRIHSSNVDFAVFLQYIKDKQYAEAKLKLVQWNDIQNEQGTYNFYGNESRFTIFLEFLIAYEMSSSQGTNLVFLLLHFTV